MKKLTGVSTVGFLALNGSNEPILLGNQKAPIIHKDKKAVLKKIATFTSAQKEAAIDAVWDEAHLRLEWENGREARMLKLSISRAIEAIWEEAHAEYAEVKKERNKYKQQSAFDRARKCR